MTIIATVIHLANNIKKIRKSHGKSQMGFAEYMGVTIHMQKSYELNRSQPDIIYMEKLTKLTGKDAQTLIGEPLDMDGLVPKETKEASKSFLKGPTKATLQDYIDLLEENDKFFKSKFTEFSTNLTALVTMVSAGDRSELAYHDVMLRSLARLEKMKDDKALIEEARNSDSELQRKELGKDKQMQTRK